MKLSRPKPSKMLPRARARASLLLALTLLLSPASAQNYTRSPKRGLVYVPSSEHPSDDSIWTRPDSDLTWYYNYSPSPTSSLSNPSDPKTNSPLEFVPMLFGVTNSTPSDDSTATPNFLYSVLDLQSKGMDIKYALAFNEPDGSSTTGGSSVSPELAATVWKSEIAPLRAHGVKVGYPAVTGAPSGMQWLDDFLGACNGGCPADFVPVHFYGSFEGLASHVGETRAKFLHIPIWVTEYGLPYSTNLTASQAFFNETEAFLGRVDYVARHSYFGAFRSTVSNVGPDEAMLDGKGELTDIGSWYLGGASTGNVPEGEGSRGGGWKGWGLLLLGWAVWSAADVWMG
jgi:hypothetical protein